MARSRLAWLVLGLVLAAGGPARADEGGWSRARGLSAGERQALLAGAIVSRPMRFERGDDGSYIGGVSYQMVHATPARVLAALADVNALPSALPRTERATLLSREGRSARVELVQGKAPFLVTYTVRFEQNERGDAIRFWLDPSRPHGVRDVWGYFRVTPVGRDKSLVTLAVALDLGPGLARLLLSDRVERMILRAPGKIREYVEPVRLTSAR